MKRTLSPLSILSSLLLVGLAAPGVLAEETVPLDIKLPEEFSGGTPVEHWSPNFEPYDYKDRPPFMAPKGSAILSVGKPVTASAAPSVGKLEQVTDGDKSFEQKSLIEIPAGLQWVQVDLEKSSTLDAVLIWHYHSGKRVYFDLVVQLSDDPDFKEGVTTLYNNDYDNSAGFGAGKDNEYVETYKGRLIDTKGAKGRYLRVYGNGNTADDFNNFVEIEVWGR